MRILILALMVFIIPSAVLAAGPSCVTEKHAALANEAYTQWDSFYSKLLKQLAFTDQVALKRQVVPFIQSFHELASGVKRWSPIDTGDHPLSGLAHPTCIAVDITLSQIVNTDWEALKPNLSAYIAKMKPDGTASFQTDLKHFDVSLLALEQDLSP